MKTPFLDQLIDEHQNHIESVEAASYAGIPETRKQLEELEGIKQLLLHSVSNNEVALKAFVKEYIEAWEDGMDGDTDLYRKAKSLL